MDVTPLATCLFYKMSMSAAATQVLTDRGRTCGDKQQCDASLTDHCAQLAVDGGYRLWDLRTSDLPIDPKKWLQQITVVFVCDGLSRSNSPLIKRWTRNQAASSLRGQLRVGGGAQLPAGSSKLGNLESYLMWGSGLMWALAGSYRVLRTKYCVSRMPDNLTPDIELNTRTADEAGRYPLVILVCPTPVFFQTVYR
jgi:hypothetical protein